MADKAAVRIVIYVRAISGGAGKNAVKYANILSRHGYAVTLACGQAPSLAQFRPDAGVELLIFGTRKNLSAVPHLRRVLAQYNPALCLVVDASNLLAMLLALPACKVRPLLVLREALSTKQRMQMRDPVMRRVKALIHRIGYRHCDSVIALTQEMERELLDFWRVPRDRVTRIPNGVEVMPMTGVPRQEDRIVCVARLEEQKDIATLLRAFALVRQDIDCRLSIAGTGRLEAELRAQAQLLKIDAAVEFLGHVDQTGPLYASAALCVLPSRWEGFPNVVIEALAQGTPVVATNTPGAVEILEGSDAGLLSEIRDVNGMAEAIRRALARAWDDNTLRARARDYSDEVLARNVAAFIDDILSIE